MSATPATSPVPAAAGRAAVRVATRRGNPPAEELAAVVAVVTEASEREAAAAIAEDSPRRSAWEVSARGLRAPLRRDVAWGRFAG